MVVSECEQLVNEYLEWLRQNISIIKIDDVCEITTPFLDRHNDHLQIYVQEENGHYLLSDDGYILADLQMSGVEFNTEKRKDILNTMLAGFGITQKNSELQIGAQRHNLAQRKHNLIQAMLAINDMFVVAGPRVFSLFREDVEQYLRAHKVRFVGLVSFPGRSGFIHNFDFAIPSSETRPERLVKAINNPTRDNVSSLIFAWNDTREARSTNAEAYAVLNDQERPLTVDARIALESYGIIPMLWSQREQYATKLAE
jgi:hypothetical protein